MGNAVDLWYIISYGMAFNITSMRYKHLACQHWNGDAAPSPCHITSWELRYPHTEVTKTITQGYLEASFHVLFVRKNCSSTDNLFCCHHINNHVRMWTPLQNLKQLYIIFVLSRSMWCRVLITLTHLGSISPWVSWLMGLMPSHSVSAIHESN